MFQLFSHNTQHTHTQKRKNKKRYLQQNTMTLTLNIRHVSQVYNMHEITRITKRFFRDITEEVSSLWILSWQLFHTSLASLATAVQVWRAEIACL